MADLGIIFLRRRYPIHWYQSSYIFITGSMPFRYFWATLYSLDKSLLLGLIFVFHNFKFQENIDTLGQEIARLSEDAHLKSGRISAASGRKKWPLNYDLMTPWPDWTFAIISSLHAVSIEQKDRVIWKRWWVGEEIRWLEVFIFSNNRGNILRHIKGIASESSAVAVCDVILLAMYCYVTMYSTLETSPLWWCQPSWKYPFTGSHFVTNNSPPPN